MTRTRTPLQQSKLKRVKITTLKRGDLVAGLNLEKSEVPVNYIPFKITSKRKDGDQLKLKTKNRDDSSSIIRMSLETFAWKVIEE